MEDTERLKQELKNDIQVLEQYIESLQQQMRVEQEYKNDVRLFNEFMEEGTEQSLLLAKDILDKDYM